MRYAKAVCLLFLNAACLAGTAGAAVIDQQLLLRSPFIPTPGVQGNYTLDILHTSHRETNDCSSGCPKLTAELGDFALFEPALGTLMDVSLSGQFSYLATLASTAQILRSTNATVSLSNDSTGSSDVTVELRMKGSAYVLQQFQVGAFVTSHLGDPQSKSASQAVDLGSIDLSGISRAFVKTPGGVGVGSLDAMIGEFLTQTWQCDTNLSVSLGEIPCRATSTWSSHFAVQGPLTLEYVYAPVPEPGSALELALGLTGLALLKRRRDVRRA